MDAAQAWALPEVVVPTPFPPEHPRTPQLLGLVGVCHRAPQLDTEMLHLAAKFCVVLRPFWRKDLSQVSSTAVSHRGLSHSNRTRSCSHSAGGTLCQTLVCFLPLHVVLALLSTAERVRSPQHRLMDNTHPKSCVSNRPGTGLAGWYLGW